MRRIASAMLLSCVVLVAACGADQLDGSEPTEAPIESVSTSRATTNRATTTTTLAAVDGGCADVIDAAARGQDGVYTIDATVSSADTGEEKYADLWEVRTPGGEVIATRILTHPHVTEQPFTRSLSGVSVPEGVSEVVVAARDSVEGFCGATFTLTLDP